MLEKVFSESAAGSMAMVIGRQKRSGGAFCDSYNQAESITMNGSREDIIGYDRLDVTLVMLPYSDDQTDGAVLQYNAWHEIEPYRWGQMAELGK